MTYNVLTGGQDGPRTERVERLLELIERERPDILALQECNGFPSDGHRLLHRFEQQLGMRGLLGRARSGFHVAVFVRNMGIVRSCSADDGFKHAVLEATVLWGDQEVDLWCVHHNPFSGTARLMEAEMIAGRVRPERLQLLMGDFNANSPVDQAHVALEALPARYRIRHAISGVRPPCLDTRSVQVVLDSGYIDLVHAQGTPWQPTAPTRLVPDKQRFPMRIDFLFASQKLAGRARSARVVCDALADSASDHYPVVADFD